MTETHVERQKRLRKEANDRYRARHPDRVRAVHRAYREKNPGKYSQLARDRRERTRTSGMTLLADLKSRCRKNGRECTVTSELLEELAAPGICMATGVPLSTEWDGPGLNPWLPSVDRIDPSKDYVPGNVRVVCWAFNRAKCNLSDEEFAIIAAGFMQTTAPAAARSQ